MSVNRKVLFTSGGGEVVIDRRSGSTWFLCVARNAGLEMRARHTLDTHRNLHAGFTGTHESISKMASSVKDGSMVGDAMVAETIASPASFREGEKEKYCFGNCHA
jgi:hypothetical protein